MLLAASLPSLSWWEILVRLVLAAGLGGAVGVEREIREREAGLRTHMMVAVGAALFTLVGAYGFDEFAGGTYARIDPTRIAAQVVTGIGFLGAGAIIRHGASIRGLTTAGTLWVVAAIGIACGAGYFAAAVITSALVITALWPLRIVAYHGLRRFHPDTGRLLVSLDAGASPGPLIAGLESEGGRIEALQISEEGDRRHVAIDVAMPPKSDHARIVSAVADVDGVVEVRWAG